MTKRLKETNTRLRNLMKKNASDNSRLFNKVVTATKKRKK